MEYVPSVHALKLAAQVDDILAGGGDPFAGIAIGMTLGQMCADGCSLLVGHPSGTTLPEGACAGLVAGLIVACTSAERILPAFRQGNDFDPMSVYSLLALLLGSDDVEAIAIDVREADDGALATYLVDRDIATMAI